VLGVEMATPGGIPRLTLGRSGILLKILDVFLKILPRL
jgi:hypothetical protein